LLNLFEFIPAGFADREVLRYMPDVFQLNLKSVYMIQDIFVRLRLVHGSILTRKRSLLRVPLPVPEAARRRALPKVTG
jgi:hypothetical protein